MEELADAIGLWMPRLGLGVLDIDQGEVELKVMGFRFATIFRAPIGQNAQHAHVVFGKKRQDPVIQKIRRGDRRLGRV